MTKYLVGTGGWSYFRVPSKRSLEIYSKVFDFVEVNYTFYEYPELQRVQKWRRMVPSDFTFAVRCHHDLTHKIGLKPTNESYEVLAKMIEYCGILNSPFLVLQTPGRYILDNEAVNNARDFLLSTNLKEVRLVWDARAPLTTEVVDLMRDLDIVESVDLSVKDPRVPSDIVYSRLFGKGWHNRYQFTDEELIDIDAKVQKLQPKIVALSYHGIRMNSDAARFKMFRKTGKFMPITSFTGLESAKAVLSEDTKFPATKSDLVQQQGWKVIDLTSDNRVHLSDVLIKIPEKTYNDLNEVLAALEGNS